MAMKRKMSKNLKRILFAFALNMALIIATFSVATFAWFSMNTTVGVGGASFTVKTPDSVSFNLYYLENFTVSASTKRGNLNTFGSLDSDDWEFTGYQTGYSGGNFAKVHYDSSNNVTDTPDPTDIKHLWPAHRLTFAIVVGSGSPSSFSLDSFEEGTPTGAKILKDGDDKNVSLSWALNMYGAAYSVNATDTGDDDADEITDIEAAYSSSYFGALTDEEDPLEDTFNYDQDSTEQSKTTIIDSIPASASGKRLIVFFTIEFSNDDSTFYVYNEETGYYTKNTSGNSNCYENLSLTSLVFSLA